MRTGSGECGGRFCREVSLDLEFEIQQLEALQTLQRGLCVHLALEADTTKQKTTTMSSKLSKKTRSNMNTTNLHHNQLQHQHEQETDNLRLIEDVHDVGDALA
jgi:hypothetical protein